MSSDRPNLSAPMEDGPIPGWVHLLASTLRLVDAHDSNRQPGLSQQASAPDEQRTCASHGVYPTVAWELLEWLRDKETEGDLDFVEVTPFIEQAATVHGISPTDGQYIVNLLATPTELNFALAGSDGLPSRRSSRDTALIEKQRRGFGCRLSRAGRDALSLASGYFKWVHAGAEARKLLIDIRNTDLRSFREQALRLLSRIRSETLEVRRALERPEIDEVRESFTRDSKRFTDTIAEVTDVLRQVQEQMQIEETRREVARVSEEIPELAMSLSILNELVRNLLNGLRSLQILFSELIREVVSRERAAVGMIRFDAAARRLLLAPEGPEIDPANLETIMEGVGPLLPAGLAFSPHELWGTVAVPKARQSRPSSPRTVGKPIPQSDRVELFVRRNQAFLIGALRRGRLSLADMFESGDVDYRDLEHMVEASVLLLSPLVLNLQADPDVRLRIELGKFQCWRLPDGWEVSGRNLILRQVFAPEHDGTGDGSC